MLAPHKLALSLTLSFLSALSAGCGGGGGASANIQPPPPPPADFSISLSSSSLSLAQGATSPPVTISLTNQNGFSNTVQVTLAGLPTGVTSNPASPFTVASSAPTAVVFGASPNATTGDFTITAQGSSGALSHSDTLALTVQAGAIASLPRTTYIRTDAVAALDAHPANPAVVASPTTQSPNIYSSPIAP